MRDFRGLIKIAFGPPQTVGQFMNSWNANLNANPALRQTAFNRINNAGLTVGSPASRIPYVVGGGLVGRAAASYLGANPFWKGVATMAGARYGNNLYNQNHPDPKMQKVAPGIVRRGF